MLCEDEKEVLKHFKPIGKNMIAYATNVVLKRSKYTFYTSGKNKRAHCTHCNKEFTIDYKVKHNSTGDCPNCNSKCIYKAAGMGRKYLQDYARFLWFDKSPVDENIITACWVNCKRNYSESFEAVETVCSRVALYVFEMGNPQMYDVTWRNRLEKRTTVFDLNHGGTEYLHYRESLAEAVKGTPYGYSGWEYYDDEDLIKYLALYSESPNVEALTKAGLENIVCVKLHNQKTHRAINWKAIKLNDFFKVSKNDFKEIKKFSEEETVAFYSRDYALFGRFALLGLKTWQRIRRNNEKIKYSKMLYEITSLNLYSYERNFDKISKFSSITKLFSYVNRQYNENKEENTYRSKSSVLITWSDYIDDCVTLEMDLTNKSVLYPKNVYEAHQQTLSLVEVKKDEITNKKIKRRYEELEKFTLEENKMIIRPPKNFDEIVREGEKLKHCVSRYANKHANNRTTLLFIRRKSRPNTPFYTVEIIRGDVAQVRGKDNKIPTKEVDEFMRVFVKEKLKNDKERNVS